MAQYTLKDNCFNGKRNRLTPHKRRPLSAAKPQWFCPYCETWKYILHHYKTLHIHVYLYTHIYVYMYIYMNKKYHTYISMVIISKFLLYDISIYFYSWLFIEETHQNWPPVFCFPPACCLKHRLKCKSETEPRKVLEKNVAFLDECLLKRPLKWGKTLENLGKTMGKPWLHHDHHGKLIGTSWGMGTSWEIHELNGYEETGNHWTICGFLPSHAWLPDNLCGGSLRYPGQKIEHKSSCGIQNDKQNHLILWYVISVH